MLRFVFVLFCLIVGSQCFQDDSNLIIDDGTYKFYPSEMSENFEFRTLSPEERKSSGVGSVTTATDFIRPFAKKAFKVCL